jgi:hypothetical protein
MRLSRTITALTTAGLLAATAVGAASTAAATPARGCTASWKVVPTPAGLIEHVITGVTVDSAGGAWFPAYNTNWDSWANHWDGRSLSATPMVPQGPYTLRSTNTLNLYSISNVGPVSFDSPTDGWMIGKTGQLDDDSPDWAAHWSGSGWTIVPLAASPDPASSVELNLFGVASVSPADAWAVGTYAHVEGLETSQLGALIEHWDGTQWRIAPNPASSLANTALYGISVVSATDIWVVGVQGLGTGASTPFAEHWDGTSWSVVRVPAGAVPSSLIAVSADSPTDAWAVGRQAEPDSNLLTGLVEHWDGHAWSVVTRLPNLGNSELLGVYAASPDDVWALHWVPTPDGELGEDVFLHWDGSSWTTVPVPGPHEYALDYDYVAIAGRGPGNIWAAGSVFDSAVPSLKPLIAHLSCR